MSHKITFADNIFFLAMKIKTLKKALVLDIDRDLFGKSIDEEIRFLASALDEIYTFLKDSQVIIDRTENLKNIQRLKLQFCYLLKSILDGTGSMSLALEEYYEEYRIVRTDYLQDIEKIRDSISGITEKSIEEKYIISEEEYRSLFSQED